MNTIRRNPYLSGLIGGLFALFGFLSLTNPHNIAIGLVTVPIILFFVIAFCAAQLILRGLPFMNDQPRKKRLVGMIAAGFLTIIVILQSTGGISGADIILLGLIIVVTAIYIERF